MNYEFDFTRALSDLDIAVNVALALDPEIIRHMTQEEIRAFQREHSGAHFVVGDFEIRCLKPENYKL